MIEEYKKLKKEHNDKFKDEYYTFNRVDFKDEKQLKREIKLLKKDVYITYEMQGWTKEDADKIRKNLVLI